MPVAPKLHSLARNLFHRRAVEREIDDEMRAYLEILTEENIAAGLTPRLARRRALLEIGGVEQVKEQVREVRRGAGLNSIWRDLCYAARSPAKLRFQTSRWWHGFPWRSVSAAPWRCSA
jgi:hypothetical protein